MKHLLVLLPLLLACPQSTTVTGDPDLGPPAVPDPIPTGASTTALVGPEGGELRLEQLTLAIPPGALDRDVELTVTASTRRAPSGFTAFSPIFQFEPEGTTFARPVEVRLPYEGDASTATIFWTNERGDFAALPTSVEPPVASTTTDHFSQAFVGTACEDCCRRAAGQLDLLLTIDDSGSMAEEQALLAAEIPRLIDALATGDIDGDGVQEFPAVADLRVGVVSTDLGGAICSSGGGGDGLLRTTGNTALPGCMATYPEWVDGSDPAASANVACVASVGTGGCGFEQPLDATLKALSPSTSGLTFPSGSTTGHGDGANAGFLRPGAVLAVLHLTDEDDCSTTDAGLFDLDDPRFDPNLNMRCFNHSDVLQPSSRYVDGLLPLVSDPTALVYAAITGVPTDTAGSDYAAILADPRMAERVDPMESTRLLPTCATARGVAYPARRMVRTASALDDAGAKTVVRSICDEDFDGAIAAILERVAAGVSGSCD